MFDDNNNDRFSREYNFEL